MSTSTIAANIQARQDAEEMIAFMGEKPTRFWQLLCTVLGEQFPEKPAPVDPLPPLTDGEAIYFERTELPYGKFVGEEVGCIACGYLLFLAEGDVFVKNLRRYVKSKRFQDRQGDE